MRYLGVAAALNGWKPYEWGRSAHYLRLIAAKDGIGPSADFSEVAEACTMIPLSRISNVLETRIGQLETICSAITAYYKYRIVWHIG
jgi:hypothetical protein